MHSLRNILAVTDLSVPGIHAAWRAGRIARSSGAGLHLLTLIDGLDRRPSSRFGPGSPPVRARSDLSHLAREIGDTLGVEVTFAVCVGDGVEPALQAARAADLVVVPLSGALRRRRDLLHGGVAERVLRGAAVPVLVAQRPSGVNYRRALAAIDLSPDAGELLALAQRVCPSARIEAFHALSLATQRHMHAADLPVALIGEQRQTIHAKARAALQALAHRAAVHEAVPMVRFGDPVRQLLMRQAEFPATLLVLGKARRAWWADLLLGSLAQRVSTRVNCDVLWVPTPLPRRSRNTALARLRHAPNPANRASG